MSGDPYPGREPGRRDNAFGPEPSRYMVVADGREVGRWSRRRADAEAIKAAPDHEVVVIRKLRDGQTPLTVGTWFKGSKVKR